MKNHTLGVQSGKEENSLAVNYLNILTIQIICQQFFPAIETETDI